MSAEERTERLAAIAKALAHPARVQIVELLAGQPECRGADLFSELPLAQSTISEHLRVLREAQIVSSTPCGTSAVYCLNAAVLEEFGRDMLRLAIASPDCSNSDGE
jgi:ArsR family transcriptional regulator, arsenate/arsenite/antimonite-responsive transcriptional repressor